ncbi:hypothetical protein DTO166G4_8617 [Paecilomyces variotii]|nr:hypothetical protein DTO166G4_8617 [Paecilomyces variotii]KAJ9228417.1 hypothetical protein DTO166G5_8572 [Paecilomyces variotii]KAJ9237391.1 hypothetical protein DTO169E5_5287 [Paecilomyces variotii]KAJ9351049.1 hypothetical protein DTO027B9_6634 [Paecilomyces variotii]
MLNMDVGHDVKWEDTSRWGQLWSISQPQEVPYRRSSITAECSRFHRDDNAFPRRRTARYHSGSLGIILLLFLISLVSPVAGAFVNFENCLEKVIIDSNPLQLQFVPLNASVVYDPSDTLHTLNVTVYGNVSGLATDEAYPAPDDPQWSNPNDTLGKIIDLSKSNNKYTTLFTKLNVLSFTPYDNASRFCTSVTQGQCPLGPVFYANASDLSELRAFSIQHDMLTSYRFATIVPTLRVRSGDASNADLACISMNITPDIGATLGDTFRYVPLIILVAVGIATVVAAMYSPWGSTDPFRWTTNYGRDQDLLRLVTPGFADCLQYIQFVVLTGGLNLDYPGFYQPVVSRASWSTLMFNQSFVSHNEINPVQDGVYTVNATYGMARLGQHVGMAEADDIWPGMAIYLLLILGGVTALIQVAFALRWLHRQIANVPEEDLRAKNMPFTVGNVIRVMFNYLLLPLVSLSMFQLVVANHSPVVAVTLAVIFIVVLVGFAVWLIRLIVSTRPRSYLFDDLSTVLLYGPLYNTFSDDAAPFALIPVFLTFLRGVAIGALQPSGIAQLVLLAICEVIFVLTLVAFRPFPYATSMNLYHTCFSAIRFVVLLLSVTFVPSLGVTEGSRGWIGYIILFIHAAVLVFGFFLNALQTLVEVAVRLAGAGGYEGVATRGGLTKVFGMRQLSRRSPRAVTRQSMNSEAAILGGVDDRRSAQFDGSRTRSFSGSSALLLNRGDLDLGSIQGRGHSRANSSGPYTPTSLGGSGIINGAGYQAMGNTSPKVGPIIGMEMHDPYYRPPRPRRKTLEGGQSQRSDEPGQKQSSNSDAEDEILDGPSGATPAAAYLGASRDDPDFDDGRPVRKDYAVREVDFYYRVRGPALSHTGTRKLKTGPADPTGPVSSATGWFRSIFGGKTKEKNKGFEVVRSARAPPPGLFPPPEGEEFHEPYRDDPGARDSDDRRAGGLSRTHSRQLSETDTSYRDSDGDDNTRPSALQPPSLPRIDSGGEVELPDRTGSQREPQARSDDPDQPPVPRKSSKRLSYIKTEFEDSARTSELLSPAGEEDATPRPYDPPGSRSTPVQSPDSQTGRLPFSTREPSNGDRTASMSSTVASTASSAPNTVLDEHGQPRHASVLGNFASDTRHDRPSSMGHVAQYRTRDHIHEASPEETSFRGSAAELVRSTSQQSVEDDD